MLKNIIEIAKGFQTSVNISYDLHDANKTASFIPTISSLEVIEEVLLSVAANSTDRARILIGAYGRGKSHIILVLLSMLFNLKKNKALFKRLMGKMKLVNPELHAYTREYLNSSRRLLPIVISGSSSSLTQSFLFALQQALNNENLHDVMPNTHFSAALKAIEYWKADYPKTYSQFLAKLGTPIDDFILKLKEYRVEAYEKFIELYPQLTAGSTFNPFLGFDVVELYEKVVDQLTLKGYDGVYIVYDEFSKYLESSIEYATLSDIKLLQDFAEKCSRSGKKQMHLMLICHKDIANYIDSQLPKEKVDGWRGVSGRFKHTSLHNNFVQMYEIIAEVIKKNQRAWDNFVDKHRSQFEDLKVRCAANGLFEGASKDELESVVYGCYPMHPVSTFILPRLSEKVAQNERTLFTFLSAGEKHTLSAFLKASHSKFPLLTPDCLYDYFEPLFRKEPYTSDIHKVYRLTSNVLQKVEGTSIHAKIIKTIALIYIIEQFEKLPPIYDVIVDVFRGVVDDPKQISQALSDLVNKECVVYLRRSNNYLKLKASSGIDIPSEIQKSIDGNRANWSAQEILNKSSFDSFMYPTRYNDEHEITRYFDFEFLSGDEFWAVKDWEAKIEVTQADGVVFAIIPNSAKQLKEIEKEITKGRGKNKRIVFCLPRKFAAIEKILFEYKAVLDLRKQVEEDELLADEYDLYIEDLEEVVGNFICSYACPETGGADYYYNGKKKLICRKAQMSALLSNICLSLYPHAPIINNESINKNILPAVAINSRSKIITGLLNTSLDENLGLTGTGQDVSIMRSTLLQTGIVENISSVPQINLTPADENIRYLMHTIQAFFAGVGAKGEQSMADLYEKLTSYKYGIGLKMGVVPIYIAAILHLCRNNVVIKKGASEQKLSADLLNMINDNPHTYSVVLENWDDEKTAYIGQLEKVFQKYIHEQEKVYNSFSYIVSAMGRWYMSLPKYSKEMTQVYKGGTSKNKFQKISLSRVRFINSLKKLDINPREYLFENLFTIFGYSKFNAEVASNIAQAKTEFDNAIDALLQVLLSDVRELFSPKKDARKSLTSIIEDWCASLNDTVQQHLFADNENKILDVMRTITNDEKTFIQRLAKAVTALRVADWNEQTVVDFVDDLSRFKQSVEEYSKQKDKGVDAADTYKLVTVTRDGEEIVKSFNRSEYGERAKLLYNDILNSIDDMGQSISDQEKRQVLFEILKKLC